MHNKIISESKRNMAKEYDSAERQIYINAIETFKHGMTYRNTPDPLRGSLQQSYAHFMVECFNRERRNSRRYDPLPRKF